MKLEEYLSGEIKYEPEHQVILVNKPDGFTNLVCEIRGWGNIKKLFIKDGEFDNISALDFHDRMGEFVAEAIREKLVKEKKENVFGWVHKKGELW